MGDLRDYGWGSDCNVRRVNSSKGALAPLLKTCTVLHFC